MGIAPHNSVFLHSGIRGFGQLIGGISTIREALEKGIPEGFLLFPTFSYSWCDSKIYDPFKTECNLMGLFGENIWKEPGFIRSGNPNFSVTSTSFTRNDSEILNLYNTDNTCFGEHSVFGNIYRWSKEKPVYIMLLGGAHDDCDFRCTFVHYIEEKVGVSYRYQKNFYNPANSNEYVTQYVKYMTKEEYIEITGNNGTGYYDFPITYDFTQLGKDLISSNIITIKPFGYSKTRMVKLDTFCDFLEEKLKDNPGYLLKKY
jgi:aminoglycoside 3-N-acetyltransferase